MREMKDSGVEWIGEIPINWNISKLKYHFKIGSGTTPKSDDSNLWDGNIVWITPADFKTEDVYVFFGHRNISEEGLKNSSLELIPAGNIIFSKRAPIGQVVINGVDLCTNQGCLSVVSVDDSNVKYYRYVMSIATEKFELEGSGTTFKEISATAFGNVTFPLPAIDDQQIIVDYLDNKCYKIDVIIKKQQAIIEKLKEYKLSVITEAVTKGLNPNVEMKDSGIEWTEQIPTHWSSMKLKYCTYVRARLGWKGLKAEEYVEEGYPLLSAFNIVNSKLDFRTNINYINQIRYDESPEIKLCLGDILLVKDGAGIGKCAIVEELPLPSTTNGSLAVITTDEKIVPKYLYYYFLSAMFQKYIDRLKAGMGVPHLFQADIKEIQVVIPSPMEQQEIVEELDNKIKFVDFQITKIQTLLGKYKEYKSSLIYEVVTGKREV